MKILVYTQCDQQGYWDTSGYCHWKKDAYSDVTVFERYEYEEETDDRLIERATDHIARFMFKYPQGDVEIYQLHDDDLGYGYEGEIHEKLLAAARERSDQIKAEAEELERQKKAEQKKKQVEAEKRRDLAELERLKKKLGK